MTGWLPDGTATWGGRPVARSIADVAPRRRAVLSGTIESAHVRSGSDASLEAVLADGTGAVRLLWLGRTEVPGITSGAAVRIEGTVLDHHGRLVILNPLYQFHRPTGGSCPGRPGRPG